MKNFLNKQREIIALLAYVMIIAGLIYLVILPLIARMGNMNDQIQQESLNQESVRLHIAQLPTIQKQYQTINEDGDLRGVLLDRNKAVTMIERLESLAEKTNNKISITIQDDNNAKKTAVKGSAPTATSLVNDLPNTNYLQMKITLNGKYNSIVSFISLLESFEYYSDIISVTINRETPEMLSQSNPGVFDSGGFSSNKVEAKTMPDSLTASLDTVFYTN